MHLQEPQSSEEKCQRKKECSSPRLLFTSLFLLYSGQKNFSISLSSNLNKVSLRELILTSKEHPFLQDGLHLHHCPSSLEFFLSTSSALCPSSKHVLVFPSLASPLRFCCASLRPQFLLHLLPLLLSVVLLSHHPPDVFSHYPVVPSTLSFVRGAFLPLSGCFPAPCFPYFYFISSLPLLLKPRHL